jgi:hypothetical protein
MTSNVIKLLLVTLALLSNFESVKAEVTANDLIQQNRNKIVQVVIVNINSGQNVSYGSGFFVTDNGLLATNYHVISSAVTFPKDNKIQYVDFSGQKREATLLSVDIVNDLALLQAEENNTEYLLLGEKLPEKGTPLYSIGNPHDRGMIVVPSTYNGLINNRFTDKINLTGAVNPGMSGGPTIDAAAKVIGINVRTSGNQIGTLVPVVSLKALIARTKTSTHNASMDTADADTANIEVIRASISQQLFEYQSAFYGPILDSDWPLDTLGPAQVPQKLLPFLSCYSISNHDDEKRRYEMVGSRCQLADWISLNSGSSLLGFIYDFQWLKSTTLNKWQLSTLFQRQMNIDLAKNYLLNNDTTNYSCHQDLVTNQHNSILKTSVCIRSYRSYDSLFDVSFRGLLLGKDNEAVIAKFSLYGVSEETGQAFTRKFVENIKWN